MRLAEGDRVAAIAAFRPGLADRDGMGDDGAPATGGPGQTGPTGGSDADLGSSASGRRRPCTRTSSRSTTATPTRSWRARSPAISARSCGKAEVFQFANENIFVKILDNVREKDVFLVQPTSHPVNQSIMELLIMIDAFKRASAGRITAVIPFYAYGRSDKKDQPRVPITARLIADMITVAGADRVLTMDLHQGQIQGFFNIPVDELTAVHLLSHYFIDKQLDDCVVVTDLGFAKRARAFAEILDAPLAIIEKRRVGNLDRAELMNVIGEVKGQRAIIVDDEIDTGGTLIEVVRALEREGVTEMYACATHGVLSDPAIERIRDSALREVVITDSIPLPAAKRLPKITVLSVAPLIGEAIKRIHRGESVGALFSSEVSFTQEMLLWDEGGDGRLGADGADGDDGEPSPADARRRATIGRPMSLQLHRPDGEGGLEPRPVDRRDWRDQLRSPRWGSGAARRPPARAENPEMNPTSRFRSVLFWLVLGARHVRDPRRRLRHGVLGATALTAPLDGRVRARRSRPILPLPCDSFPVSSTRTTASCDASSRWSTRPTRLEAEFEALSDDEIRAQFAEIRDEIRALADGRRAVRGRADPPRPRAPPRAAQGAPQARERGTSRRPSTRSCPRSSRWPARRCSGRSGCATSTSSSSAASSSTRARSPR